MSRLSKSRFEAAFRRQKEEVATDADAADPVDAVWAMIEPALEEKGRFEHEQREHLRETTEDIRSWRVARTFATRFAVFIVLVMLAIIGVVFGGLWGASFNNMGGDGVRITFLSATFGIVFGLTALLVRGAFSPSKRDDGAMMPEGARTLLDALQSLISRT